MNLSILYRGPLSSCNYACSYCPFAKHTETSAELAHDRACLERFVGWVAGQGTENFGILFTPWGEALVRRWYQTAIAELTHLSHVRKVAIQTNLSCKLDWLESCDKSKLGLWCTYHPPEVERARFVAKCEELSAAGVRFSVGVVGKTEHLGEIAAMREALPKSVYLWVNAYKREPNYYTPEMLKDLTTIDPHFPTNNQYHPSLGDACQAGETVFTVDGDGEMRRCHFIDRRIGNIYEPTWREGLKARPCTNDTCGCHIGYVHLHKLSLERVYGPGILERIPQAQLGLQTIGEGNQETLFTTEFTESTEKNF
ncbi:MAG: STM4011 family radical SAM protein [Fimbriiglobus sp.]